MKVDDIRASMTMGQPFPGVWLPRELNIHSGITLANGSFEGGYGRKFAEYRLAEVATKMRVPKQRPANPTTTSRRSRGHGPFVPARLSAVASAKAGDSDSHPAVEPAGESSEAGAGAFQPEVIGEIRIHGNAFLTDKEVLDFAGDRRRPAAGRPTASRRSPSA